MAQRALIPLQYWTDGSYHPYAGIGSRETPDEILGRMNYLAEMLADLGYTLRSGGAQGADTAFYEGTKPHQREIFLPWKKFFKEGRIVTNHPEYYELQEIAANHHSHWHNCSPGARKLLTRNTLQILGWSRTWNSEFVICWTKNGKFIGGTGTALRIADGLGIPIFNLHSEDDYECLLESIQKAYRPSLRIEEPL